MLEREEETIDSSIYLIVSGKKVFHLCLCCVYSFSSVFCGEDGNSEFVRAGLATRRRCV